MTEQPYNPEPKAKITVEVSQSVNDRGYRDWHTTYEQEIPEAGLDLLAIIRAVNCVIKDPNQPGM